MPFTLIKGTFHPEFGNPDGDSLRFLADDPEPIFKLRRRKHPARLSRVNGSIQLRYEGIDTMETGALEPYTSDATQANLDLAGTNGGSQPARGYILSNQLGPNGRPIAFVFAGDTYVEDGRDDIFVTPEDIKTSLNVQLLRAGHAYPLFYDTLFLDLRQTCREASLEAKEALRGVWAADATQNGAEWTGNPDTMAPLFPKLWRRIDKFSRDEDFFNPARPMANLPAYVAQLGEERVIDTSTGRTTGFDNLIEVTDTTVKLNSKPEDLVIISA